MLKLIELGEGGLSMNQNSEKPFKHYERPSETRTATNRPGVKVWLVTMILLFIVIIALVPIVHHLAANADHGSQAVEVQKTTAKKKQSQTKTSKPKTKPKAKAKEKVKTNSEVKAKEKKQAPAHNQAPQVETYVVQSGDTLTSIANRYNLTVYDLAQLNQLDPDGQVNAGAVLRVK